MKRLIYKSRAVRDFGEGELLALLGGARRRNHDVDVTGMLIYTGRSFLQMLEGEVGAVQKVFTRIMADSRHTKLRILKDADVQRRLFDDWAMGFERVDQQELAARIQGYRPASDFPLMNPMYIVDGDVAETMLTLYAAHETA